MDNFCIVVEIVGCIVAVIALIAGIVLDFVKGYDFTMPIAICIIFGTTVVEKLINQKPKDTNFKWHVAATVIWMIVAILQVTDVFI